MKHGYINMSKNGRRLVDRVREVDPEAAAWLCGKEAETAYRLYTDGCPDRLICLFTWHESPQGHNYWCKIHLATGGMT
jgi:hypothetical protein